MNLDVVELFAGVGGFRVGLNQISEFDKESGKAIEKGGWNFVWANQFEPSTKTQHAFECYTTRFGEDDCSNEDVNLVDKKKNSKSYFIGWRISLPRLFSCAFIEWRKRNSWEKRCTLLGY